MAGAFVLVSFTTASPAVAKAPSATGWWWVGRPSAVVATPAPSVPEGGLYVAGGFGQPTGVSALRFELETTDVADTLTFEIAEAVGTPAVLGCRTTKPWKPAEGGAWSDRPTADCERGSATAERSGDGQQLRLDVSSLQHDGAVDIVLMPATDRGSSPFSISIKRPGADALSLQPATDTSAPLDPAGAHVPVEPLPAIPDSSTFSLPLPEQSFANNAPRAPQATSTNLVAAPAAFGGIAKGFAYPIVFVLPLLLLGSGSVFAWALTRPIVVGQGWSAAAGARQTKTNPR